MIFFYLILLVALSFFSYTQTDLNLTVLNTPSFLRVQESLIQLGYFNRPLNTIIWSILGISMILIYLIMVRSAIRNTIKVDTIVKWVLSTAIVLMFSYTIFSHDIFNYMFDARIITVYGQNPYQHKALDYPSDSWIRFMQWTHRTYPYGPLWLVISVVPSLLGFAKFLPTYLLFKLLFSLCYLVSCWSLYRIAIALKISPTVSVALFAFHPLVIVDGLISPRVDSVMIALSLYGTSLVLEGYTRKGVGIIIASSLVKFATILMVPLVILAKSKTKILTLGLFISALCGTVAQSLYSQTLQPWYLLMPVAYLPLLQVNVKLRYVLLLSAVAILPLWVYLAFIQTGRWFPVI